MFRNRGDSFLSRKAQTLRPKMTVKNGAATLSVTTLVITTFSIIVTKCNTLHNDLGFGLKICN
jgi:hypothetical protein